jgi:hypothetical protein
MKMINFFQFSYSYNSRPYTIRKIRTQITNNNRIKKILLLTFFIILFLGFIYLFWHNVRLYVLMGIQGLTNFLTELVILRLERQNAYAMMKEEEHKSHIINITSEDDANLINSSFRNIEPSDEQAKRITKSTNNIVGASVSHAIAFGVGGYMVGGLRVAQTSCISTGLSMGIYQTGVEINPTPTPPISQNNIINVYGNNNILNVQINQNTQIIVKNESHGTIIHETNNYEEEKNNTEND